MSKFLLTTSKLVKIIFLLFKLLIFYIKNDLKKERQNTRFWCILTFATGILQCFFCNPEFRIIYILCIAVFILLIFFYNIIFEKKSVIIKFLLFFAFGFSIAFLKCIKIDKNNFKSPVFNTTINGKIEQIKLTPTENILFLKIIKSPNSELFNKVVRVKYNNQLLEQVNNGDIVRVKTSLIPTKYSFFPQDKSYENYAKFFDIIATGYAKDIKIIKKKNINTFFDIQKYRNNIQKHIFNVNNKSAGAGIVIAILTGNNSFIPKEQLSNIRRSGCAHILAISGLHMSIVVAFVFLFFIHFFALFPKIALKYNTKKLATIPAIIACLFYLQISNIPISATRSFLMVLIGAIATLLNRSKTSINTLFITFFSMLIISPNYLLSPSFQMSFIAVFGLITIYNNNFIIDNFTSTKKTLRKYIFGILLSSIIATFFTVFFEIYHFKQYAWIGLVSNIPVIPISEFLVLPFGFLGILLNNTYIGDLCYIISGFFANIICLITDWTANLPYSFLLTKQMSNMQLSTIISGIIILFLSYAKILKIIGSILFLIGFISYIKSPNFVLVYEKNFKNIVFFENKKFYSFNKIKNEYIYSIWSQNLGSNIEQMSKENKSFKCNNLGKNMSCEYTIDGIKINIEQERKNNKIIGVKIINNKPVFISTNIDYKKE